MPLTITLYVPMRYYIIQFVQWNKNIPYKSISEALWNNMTTIYSDLFSFQKNKKGFNEETVGSVDSISVYRH